MEGVRLCDDGRILVPGGLRLTLQRAFPEDWKSGGNVPRSYGRLPFVLAPNEAAFAIPLLPGEIVWIGLEAPPPHAVAEVDVTFPDDQRDRHLECPPDFAIASAYTGEDARPFRANDTLHFLVRSTRDDARHRFMLQASSAERVLPSGWQQAYGRLDRTRGYSGGRLP